jgi:DNA polymerase-3 subunit epsilon
MTWWERPIAVFDVETTGKDPKEARIVQAALLLMQPDGTVDKDSSLRGLVNPGVPIPEEAAKVHGVTDARAAKGTPAPQAVAKLVRALLDGPMAGLPVVIFNAGYDWTVLRCEAARHGVPELEQLLARRPRFVDPLVIDRKLDRYRKGGRKLGDLCRHYRVTIENAHDAVADAAATGRLALKLPHRHADVRKAPLEVLQALQREWFAEWRDHINRYWASQGKDSRVRGEWLDPA